MLTDESLPIDNDGITFGVPVAILDGAMYLFGSVSNKPHLHHTDAHSS